MAVAKSDTADTDSGLLAIHALEHDHYVLLLRGHVPVSRGHQNVHDQGNLRDVPGPTDALGQNYLE